MRTKFPRLFGGVVSLAMAATVAILPAHANAENIRIGWLPALTGPLASSAIAENYGAKIAVEEINAAGGVLGRKLELVTRDTGSDPAKAVNFAKELFYNEKIHVLLGPANSGEALPVMAASAAAKVPTIVLGAVNELIDNKKYPHAFRTIVTNDQWVDAAVDFAVLDLEKTKVAVLADTSGYGTISRQSIVEALKQHGVEPVYTALIDANRPDVTDELNKARAASADVVFAWSASSGLLARILNARGDQGWDVPVLGQPTLGFGGVGELLSKPEYWDGVYSTGFQNSTRGPDGEIPPLTAAFLEQNKDTVGTVLPNGLPVILLGYSSIYLIRDALADAGSTEPDAIKDAFEKIKDVELPYATFSFSAENHNGFPDDGIVMNTSNSLSGGLYDLPDAAK